VSLAALMQERSDGSDFRVGRTTARTSDYTAHEIRYRGDGLTLSGTMHVPRGDGPFPVVVLNHGYIDPEVYTSGRGFERSQPYLARNGFAAVHIDYRNHAASDRDPSNDVRMRLGYIEDAINAVRAIERSNLAYLDGERIGMLGRSMGGGVTYGALVVDPGIVDAAVVFASVSTDTVDNFNKWIRPREELAGRILERYGTPAAAPEFWDGVSPRSHLDRIEAPMLVHHGTADDTCPIGWTEETVDALRAADVDVTYHRYRGEGHQLYADYDLSMRRTVSFLRQHLNAA
jgi:dipeptidyl aminopeptidase/acylaminoacyl peptidase